MHSSDVTVDALLNASNPAFIGAVKEDLFEMALNLKNTMDQGVSPDEFEQYQAMAQAVENAQVAVEKFMDQM